MIIFLFILLLVAMFVIYYRDNSKIVQQKKQIILLSKQNKKLKNKVNSRREELNNLIVKFEIPKFKNGITNDKCAIHIAPIDSSILLDTIEKDTKVQIIDSAELLEEIWYEISVDKENSINNKGWIKEESITKINIEEVI